MRVNMRTGMCINMCRDMCIDMCIDESVDIELIWSRRHVGAGNLIGQNYLDNDCMNHSYRGHRYTGNT